MRSTKQRQTKIRRKAKEEKINRRRTDKPTETERGDWWKLQTNE